MNQPKTFQIAVLLGDGIGPEVIAEGIKVLRAVEAKLHDVPFTLQEFSVGAAEYLRSGDPLPPQTFEQIKQCDAILLGAMGLPNVRWPNGVEMTPQIDLREWLDLYGGLRPIRLHHALNPLWPTSAFSFETALEYKLPIVVHTGSGIPYSLPSLYIVPARQYPDLQIVLGHCGGGGMFMAEAIVAAMVCPNIYLELSSLMPHHVAEVLQHVPSNRLMIGSDLPESLTTELSKILFMQLSPEATRDIFWNTARDLFERGRTYATQPQSVVQELGAMQAQDYAGAK